MPDPTPERRADQCEWEPKHGRPAHTEDEPHADATVSVGADGQWHLCASCAQLPQFKRFTTRKDIGR